MTESLVVARSETVLVRNRRVLAARRDEATCRLLDALRCAKRPPTDARPGLAALGAEPHEAQAAVAEAGVSAARVVVVFGFGSGHLLDASLDVAARDAQVVLAVLDPGHFLGVLASRSLVKTLSDPRLRIAFGGLREITGALPRTTEELAIVAHPADLALAEDALLPLVAMATELRAARRSMISLRGHVAQNVAANLDTILEAPAAGDLRRWLLGRPVLLVAPGPSLASAFETLRRPHGLLVVACDTALRPLVSAGLAPDLAVTLDSSPLNIAKLDGLEPTWPLVFFDGAHPEVVRRHAKRFFACEREGLLDRSDPFFSRGGRFSSRGSVLTAALDVLLECGSAPIVLVGADLAHAAGRSHVDGTARQPCALPQRLVLSKAHGRVATTESLWRHRRRLLRLASSVPRGRIVDATSAGALLEGVPRMSLEDVLETYPATVGAASAAAAIRAVPILPLELQSQIDARLRAGAAARRALLDFSCGGVVTP